MEEPKKLMAHKTTLLQPSNWLSTHYTYEKHDGKVPIDENIAPMISHMWKLGLNTTSSCQAAANPFYRSDLRRNKVWLLFYSIKELEKFVKYTTGCKRDKWYIYSHIEEQDRIVAGLYFPAYQTELVTKQLKQQLKFIKKRDKL